MRLYLDTCIWLNVFKKEEPFWKSSQDLIEKAMFSDTKIFYSGFVLKELKHKLGENFKEKLTFLKQECEFIKAEEQDYQRAKTLETGSISFFDCVHIAISERKNCTLVTRDKLLMDFAKNYVKVKKPELLI